MSDSVSEVCTIHNVAFGGGFTMISNKIFENPNLSWQAKGLLSYILSRPPNWHVHSWQLSKIYEGEKKGNGLFSIKTIIKELKDNGYINYLKSRDMKGRWIHRYDVYPMPYEEFKKFFPEVVLPPVDCPASVNRPIIINTELENTELPINTCADKVDAKKSKKPKKDKPNEEDKPQRRPLIHTSDEEHAKLIEKFGQQTTDEAYDYLDLWKVSKLQTEPALVKKHTDYYRIIKWVVKDMEQEKSKKQIDESREWEKINRDLFFMLKNKYPQEMKTCQYTNGYIINSLNGKDVMIKTNPEQFKNILANVIGATIND